MIDCSSLILVRSEAVRMTKGKGKDWGPKDVGEGEWEVDWDMEGGYRENSRGYRENESGSKEHSKENNMIFRSWEILREWVGYRWGRMLCRIGIHGGGCWGNERCKLGK
jgi:hypothetical protein